MEEGRNMKQPHLFTHTFRICLLLGLLTLSLLAGLVVTRPPTRAAATTAPTQCNSYKIPVSTGPLNLLTYHVAAWLCYQQAPGQTVQILVHGGTYNHTYWDFSCSACQTNDYSYVQYMAQSGYTTFTYDRLGFGQSDHPLPELVTLQMGAYVLSQLMTDLKTGADGLPRFQKEILVGHSIGSALVVDEASNPTLARPDGVILSGFLHYLDDVKLALYLTDLEPALLDPNLSPNAVLPGYLTTVPGARGQIFYDLSNVDPQVLAEDEATKDVVTDSEVLTTFTKITLSLLTLQIRVPVLEAVGEYDNLFCLGILNCTNTSAVANYEALYYAPSAHLQVIVIPQAGHDLNLQKNASTVWFPQVRQWLRTYMF